jgi:GcrA cell cycle regulator
MDGLLISMWNDGRSSQIIANHLHVSRSAVVGKVFRLRKAGVILRSDHPSPGSIESRRRATKLRLAKNAGLKRRREARLTVVQRMIRDAHASYPRLPEYDEEPKVLRIEDLEPHHCKFPIGDPQRQGFGWCGEARKIGLPYCEKHVARAYRPNPRTESVPENTDGPPPPSESEPPKLEHELIPS